MKKLKLLLTLLLVAVGVSTTWAATEDRVTVATNLNPNKSYYLKTAGTSAESSRGYLDAAFSGSSGNVTSTENAGKFVFIPRADGTYYIYNVNQNKFVSSLNTNGIQNVDNPDGTYTLISTTGTVTGATNSTNKVSDCFVLQSNSGSKPWIQLGGSNQAVLDANWKQLDAGNQWEIYEAADFEYSADLCAKLNTATDSYGNKLVNDKNYFMLLPNRNSSNAPHHYALKGTINSSKYIELVNDNEYFIGSDGAQSYFWNINMVNDAEGMPQYVVKNVGQNKYISFSSYGSAPNNALLSQKEAANAEKFQLLDYTTTSTSTTYWRLHTTGGSNIFSNNGGSGQGMGLWNDNNDTGGHLQFRPVAAVTIEFVSENGADLSALKWGINGGEATNVNGTYYFLRNITSFNLTANAALKLNGAATTLEDIANAINTATSDITVTVTISRELIPATFVYTDEVGNTFTREATDVNGVTELEAFALNLIEDNYRAYFEVTSVTEAESTEGTRRYNVEVQNKFPFKVSKAPTEADGVYSFEDKASTWYQIKIKDGGKYVTYEDDALIKVTETTSALAKKYLWSFVKAPGTLDEFKIYSLAKGAEVSLGYGEVTSTTTITSFNATNTHTTFKFVRPTDTDCDNYFALEATDVADAHMGSHATLNNNANTGFGFWNNGSSRNGGGSKLYVVTVADVLKEKSIEVAEPDPAYSGAGGYVGGIVQEGSKDFEHYKSLYLQDKLEGLVGLIENQDGKPVVNEISTDKYYQLISYNDGQCYGQTVYAEPVLNKDGSYAGEPESHRGLYIKNGPATALTAIQFVADGTTGGYDIKHMNSGYWFVNLNAIGDMGQADLPINQPGTDIQYILNQERGKSNVWFLRCNTSDAKFLHCGTGNGSVICRQSPATTNDGNLWLIKELREITVSVGSAGWASIYLPFAITVENDDEVYYATSTSETTIHLEAVEAGTTVAANTGLLVADQGSHTFAISIAAGATPEGNMLTGVNASRTGYAEGSYYALAKPAKEVVGFYKSNVTTLPANKAIFVPQSTQVRGFVFDLGNATATGIDSLQSNEEKEYYYDLNGRLVAFPTTGIYVNNKGQKVLVK